MTPLAHAAREIFVEALRSVNPRDAVRQALGHDAQALRLGATIVPRSDVDELLIVAVGKAAHSMFHAAEEALDGVVPIRAIVVDPGVTRHSTHRIAMLRGAHPYPDESSAEAAASVLNLLAQSTSRTAVLFLISGGASAMVEQPLDPSLTLDDVRLFHRALIHSGLNIGEMNALRKHFSAVKGGRLALAAANAHSQSTLLLSDVPPSQMDAIGSGPTCPDSSTIEDCRALLARIQHRVTEPVHDFFAGPHFVETPKPDNAAFQRATWSVVLSSEELAQAAVRCAQARGFHVEVDNSCDEWEYRHAARHLLARSRDLASRYPKSCLISAGEVSVTLPSTAGEGGRNQQFALFCASELHRLGQSATVLSAGSDGIDGTSPAAGAVCDENTVDSATSHGLNAALALEKFDSAPLLRALGADVTTGRSGNNLRDLRLILTDS